MVSLIASTSSATNGSVTAPALRQLVASFCSNKRSYATAASTSSAAPASTGGTNSSSYSRVQPLPSTPKPPTKSWYSGRPALTEFIANLQDTVRKSRQELFRRGYLGSIDEDTRKITTSAVASTSALTLTDASTTIPAAPIPGVRWLSQEDMAARLQVTSVRLAHYRRITALLSELHALAPLLSRSADFLNTSAAFSADGRALYGSDTQQTIVQSLIRDFARMNALVVENGQTAVTASRNKGRGAFDTSSGVAYAVGRKKSSSARVWIIPLVKPAEPVAEKAEPTAETDAPNTKASRKQPKRKVASADDQPKSAEPSQQAVPVKGTILINAMAVERYFPDVAIQTQLQRPFTLTESAGQYNVFILTRGGGTVSQAQAAASACARALAAMDESGTRKAILSKADLLRRDPRVVERKKTGMPKARKRYTWVKR